MAGSRPVRIRFRTAWRVMPSAAAACATLRYAPSAITWGDQRTTGQAAGASRPSTLGADEPVEGGDQGVSERDRVVTALLREPGRRHRDVSRLVASAADA